MELNSFSPSYPSSLGRSSERIDVLSLPVKTREETIGGGGWGVGGSWPKR